MRTSITAKCWVQLVSNSELAARRISYRGTWLEHGGVKEHWWREIQLVATSDGVELRLASVDEEASSGGYCCGWHDVKLYKFSLADLWDVEGLPHRFPGEATPVVKAIERMFEALRSHIRGVREMFADLEMSCAA